MRLCRLGGMGYEGVMVRLKKESLAVLLLGREDLLSEGMMMGFDGFWGFVASLLGLELFI